MLLHVLHAQQPAFRGTDIIDLTTGQGCSPDGTTLWSQFLPSHWSCAASCPVRGLQELYALHWHDLGCALLTDPL